MWWRSGLQAMWPWPGDGGPRGKIGRPARRVRRGRCLVTPNRFLFAPSMHSPIATTTPSTASGSLPPDADRGALQVPHLKRCWSRWMAARQGQGLKGAEAEAHRTQIVLAAQAVWEAVRADPANVESWYAHAPRNTMVQMFQHPAFDVNRRSLRIHKAFAQLWGTADLWRSTDRCGFNPPERPGYPYGGQGMHWDVSLHQPIPFATQGILYLTDTPPEQGALTLVPGFHRRVGDWLAQLPA